MPDTSYSGVKEDLGRMLAEQKRELELKEKEARSQAKYRARPWDEMYPMVGPPPVLSTENQQAYAELLTAFTEMLQPQDIMAQLLVKQAVVRCSKLADLLDHVVGAGKRRRRHGEAKHARRSRIDD